MYATVSMSIYFIKMINEIMSTLFILLFINKIHFFLWSLRELEARRPRRCAVAEAAVCPRPMRAPSGSVELKQTITT